MFACLCIIDCPHILFQALPVLYPPLRNVIGGLTFSQLIEALKDFTSDSLTCESLTLACQNKVGALSWCLPFLFLSGSFFSLNSSPFSLDCPYCTLSCPMERSCCPQVFLQSPASVTLRPGGHFKANVHDGDYSNMQIETLTFILFLFFLGLTQYSRWRDSCPNVHWWSHCSCRQTCSLFSAVTWTNALYIS